MDLNASRAKDLNAASDGFFENFSSFNRLIDQLSHVDGNVFFIESLNPFVKASGNQDLIDETQEAFGVFLSVFQKGLFDIVR